MRALGLVLDVIAFLLLTIEAVGERRASRWKDDLEGADDYIEGIHHQAMGDDGSRMWRSHSPRMFLLFGIWLAARIARFDAWKDRHHVTNVFFLLALVLGISGIVLSIAFS